MYPILNLTGLPYSAFCSVNLAFYVLAGRSKAFLYHLVCLDIMIKGVVLLPHR